MSRSTRKNFFSHKNILITAGPTREYWDPVRYLSNASSGRLGFALAEEAKMRGARVTLVSGPVELSPPSGVRFVPVVSARDMQRAVEKRFPSTHIVIAAAAVSDWRPATPSRSKIKKSSSPKSLRLVLNPDILANLGRKKGRKALVGFALETKTLLASARRKLQAKNLDVIAANRPEWTLGRTSGRLLLLNRAGRQRMVSGSKRTLAQALLSFLEQSLIL